MAWRKDCLQSRVVSLPGGGVLVGISEVQPARCIAGTPNELWADR
jgi:hypothetical protein